MNTNIRSKLAYLGVLGGLLSGAAWAGHNAKRADVERYPSLVVKFEKGSSALSDGTKKDISSFIKKARVNERINEVYVAAWADEPRVGDKSLTDDQEDLARRRAHSLRAFLEELNVDVDTFNMAKRTDLWARMFNTEEARVKGHKPAGRDRVALLIQDEGRPSAAVLVIEPEKKLSE